ncbi:MAG TPA: cytochrome c peroxidase [Flavobacterium sp.]|uniref:cytochrome-c peroxidase n=1 Tax=Flavobacterium sp. TaxID=239 RepID=UPI002CF038B6|nr:cytochrome c peroxidase [Flavobacterium sp.]HNP33589.1 cytochrome c peroxidase [Flavobacterium sp.]
MKTKYLLLFILPLLWSCTDNDDKYVDVPITFKVPSNFPPLVYDVQNNPITEKGFELGRKLFYDGRLSSDGTISCGFCHEQQNAFTHHGHTVSQGVDGHTGTRNTPSIQNLGFQTSFMYDGATEHLNLQPILPITNPIEMNGNFSQIVDMMNGDAEYRKLFALAFPGKPINTENMLNAMAQFLVMVTSSNSRFDKYRRNEAGGTLTQDELDGYALFNAKCASCHATDLFTDNSFRNNGLAVNPAVNDIGRYRVTLNDADKYKFKVPSLRNVEKTKPYMHDGRFFTLEAVLDHYSSGIVNSATLDPSLNNNGTLGIPLTATEKTKIITFLKTLTDDQYLTDKRFSEFN